MSCELERIVMTKFLKAQFENMTQEQLMDNLIATAIEGAKLEEENEELKEDKEVLEDMTRRLDWASECEPLRCGYHKQFEHAVSRLIDYNEELKKENERLKISFNIEESDEECPYCENGGCGMRPDGVECKDCAKTKSDEEVPEKYSPRSPDVIRFGCRV